MGNLKKIAFPLMNFVWRYPEKKALRTKSTFKFANVSTVFVENELRKLKRNKAAGSDYLPPNLLKDCASVIGPPITYIINLSLYKSTVPNLWKVAKLCPVFKAGNADLVENYRPISVLPVLSKIMERAVHQQLYRYLESNNLLNDCQFGYRKKRSTKLATTLFCDMIRKYVDQGYMVGGLFLDLSKAFDTIGHSVLLEKLMLYGICGPELSWFTDYLFNRSQHVELNNVISETRNITSGVPQGSILGPLLFITFFNDLKDNLNHCKIIQYADDTVIFFADKNAKIIEDTLNMELHQIGRYCEQNELLLNLKKGKTEVMLFGSSQRLSRHGKTLNIMHNNTRINFVTEYVYLGNLIDNHLTLSSNFDRAYKKACGRLRLLSTVRRNLTTDTAHLIYKTMILPILTYSSTIKTTFTVTQLLKFTSLEQRAEKIIGKSTKSIQESTKIQICLLVKKCLKKEICHPIFDNYFKVLRHNNRTRNNQLSLVMPPIKLEFARPSFYYGGTKIFNSLTLADRSSMLS